MNNLSRFAEDSSDDMTKFTWGDIVTAKPDAPQELRPGKRAWIVGVIKKEERVVYTIEFEDSSDAQARESELIMLLPNEEEP